MSLNVVGFSRLVQRNERQTLRLVQRVYDRLIARTIDLAAAKDSLERFIGERSGISLTSVGDGLRFMEPALLSKYLRGLKLAGLQ